jgi:MurNAc alpha-1-phosphate uridylyltransferase
MQMVILAGGLASRMRPLSEVVPNPLISVEGRPFLAYQLDLLRANGIHRVLLCVGHLAHKVKAYFGAGEAFGVAIQYSEDGPRPLGTAGALRKARRLLDDTFFVMHGDTYLVIQYPRIWSYFHRFERQGLLVLNAKRLVPRGLSRARRLRSRAATTRTGRAQSLATCAVHDGLVTRYRSGNLDVAFSDAGLSVLRKDALSLIPARRRLDLPVLFNRLAKAGQLLALRTESGPHSIGSYAGLSEFRRYIAAMSA